jgi:hypothetical protein
MIENIKKWLDEKINKKPSQHNKIPMKNLDYIQQELEMDLSILSFEWNSLQKALNIDNEVVLDEQQKIVLANFLFKTDETNTKNPDVELAFFLIKQAEKIIKNEIGDSIKEDAQEIQSSINQAKTLRARNKVLYTSERLNKMLANPNMKEHIELLEKMAKETSEKEERLKGKNNERK